MKRARLALALLALALGAAACSRISLSWKAAPWLLGLEGADWLGLQGPEKAAFRADVRAWMDVEGREQAPRLAAAARRLAQAVALKRDAAAVALLYDEGPGLWDGALEPALKPLSAWLLREPARRAEALQKAFAERNARDFQRWADPVHTQADRERRLRLGLKDWIGDLSETQDEGVRAWAKDEAFPVDAWKADRLRCQAGLLQALRRGDGAPALEARLRAWWIEPEKDRDPAYQRALDAYRSRLRAASLRLLASLDAGQRERVVQRINAIAEDLEGIARKGAEKAGK